MFSSRSCTRWFSVVLSLALVISWARLAMAADVSIASLSPAVAMAGGEDFTLTLQGTNFTSASMVLWDGAALKTVYKNEAELTAIIPSSLIVNSGVFAVTVRTEGADAQSTEFTVVSPSGQSAGVSATPRAASFSTHVTASAPATVPAALPSAPLSSNVSPASTSASALASTPVSAPASVPLTTSFSPQDSTPISIPASTSASTLESALPLSVTGSTALATIPTNTNHASSESANPVSGMVKSPVIGSSSPSFSFSVGPPPATSSLNPSSAIAGGSGFTLTINGSNFTSTSNAMWGTTALVTKYVSAEQLTAVVPASLIVSAGTTSITVNDLSGISSTLAFTVLPPPPSILSLSPASAIAGSTAFTLTVNGTNFTSASTALWNATPLTVSFVSSKQLTAAIPASLIASFGTASITVSNVSGISLGVAFTVNPPAPTITSLSPASAIAGGAAFTLTVNGSNFTSTSTVAFGATQLAATFISATQMTATVPAALIASVGTASVTVSNITGSSSAAVFTINPPLPTIAILNPGVAVAGSTAFTLNIYGTGFSAVSTAKWNTSALATTYVSPTQVTAVIPASLTAASGTACVTVSNVSGASPGASFTVNPPAPTIASLSPANVNAGGNAFTLTVNGTNFTSNWTLWWGSTELPSTFFNSTQITATVPATLIASVGTASVTVSTVTGRSPAATLTIVQPPPTVTSLNPANAVAGGTDLLLAINGTNFDAASIASWGSTALATTLISSTQLTATVPAVLTANVGTGSVSVHTDGGSSSSLVFTINPPPPTVTSLSPTSASAGSAAFTLTVNGTNFTATSTAKWNSTSLTTTYVSATQLTATVPANLFPYAGTASITVSTAGGVSPGATFTINPPTPTISSLSPASAVASNAAYALTIYGRNFTAASTVQCNATALAATYVNTTQMTVAVPANLFTSAGVASVTISNMTGTSSSATITINPALAVITSLSPNSVLTNNTAFTLTVNGINFQPGAGVTVVRWNGVALATTYVNSTQLTATVPANLLPFGSASIYVITPSGTSSGFPFTVNPPPPTISNLGLTAIPAGHGSFITNIYGSYFTPQMVVNWGSTPLSGTLVAGSTFSYTVPANLLETAGPVSLTVTTAGGTSAPITFTVTQPQPTITSISPASIATGSAAFTLTVNGTNFITNMNTRWGSTWVGANNVSPTQLTVTIPASMVAAAGIVGVLVYIPGAGYSASLPFTINPAPPVITSISPTSATAGGAGFMLSITGTAFTTTSTAMWGTTSLDTIYVSPTLLRASVPASLIVNAGTASISVVSPAGTSVSANFLISPAQPEISGLNPGAAMAGGPAFTMTVSGAYFTPSTTSKWGSTALTTTYINSTQLTVAVPAKLISSVGSGSITVTTTVGTSPPATFLISGPPSITTTAMPSGSVGLAYSGPIHVTGGTPGYAWTVTGLPFNFTYFNTSGGTLTITGTPASTGPISFQVSAQDTVGATASPVTLTIHIAAGPNSANNGSLNGSYTCLLQGSIDDDGSRWASVLNFQADGQGNFSNGIFDINSYDIGSASGIVSGSYNIGADNNGTASIRTILTNNAAGIQTTQWAVALSGSAQPSTEFRLVEDDDLGIWPSGQQGTGDCYLATPSAFAASSINGSSFAYGMDGEDNSSNLKATAGQFSASNGAITNGYLDTTLGGSATDQSTSFTGSYTAPDPVWGRFTIALKDAGNSTGYTVYIIDTSRMFILDNTSDDGEQAGSLRVQQPAAITTAALSGPFVLYDRGAAFSTNSGIPTSFYANLLLGAGDGAGNMTIQQSYANNAGSYSAEKSNGGPTALTFDSANPGRANFQTASGTTSLYFFNANSAFELSVGTNGSVDSGWLEAQSAAQSQTTFTNAALSGNYLFGELPLFSIQPTAYVGEYSLNSSGAISAGVTATAQGTLSWDQPLTAAFSWDTTSSGGFFITNGAQGKASCAVISATRFACIPQTDPAPSVQIVQQ